MDGLLLCYLVGIVISGGSPDDLWTIIYIRRRKDGQWICLLEKPHSKYRAIPHRVERPLSEIIDLNPSLKINPEFINLGIIPWAEDIHSLFEQRHRNAVVAFLSVVLAGRAS